jgi:hypothetical protein
VVDLSELFLGQVAGRQGIKTHAKPLPKPRDKPKSSTPPPPNQGTESNTTHKTRKKGRLTKTPSLTQRKHTIICQDINDSLLRTHGVDITTTHTSQASYSEKLDAHAALMLQAAVLNSTEQRYESHWKHWVKFRSEYTVTPPDDCIFLTNSNLTAKVRTVCAFVSYLHHLQSLRASTMSGTLSGVKHAFRSALQDLDFFDTPHVKAVKHAAVRIDQKAGLSKTHRKLPFTLDMIQFLLGFTKLSNIRYHMYAVAIQLSYFGLYRSSEIIHDANAEFHNEEHALRTSDVVFFIGKQRTPVNYSDIKSVAFNTIDSMKLTLRSAKNDQARRGKKTFFTAEDFGPGTINMVRVMYDWAIRSAVQHGGILMSYWDPVSGNISNLTYYNLNNTIKKVAREMGYDQSKYAAHSPRVGGASTLRACNTPDPFIQMMGHWDSAATPKTYEDDNVREFIVCQRTLATSKDYSSAVVQLFQDSYLRPPSNKQELDICAEAV